MKILLLSRWETSYSSERLITEARARGHEVQVVDPLKCYMNIHPDHPDVFYEERSLKTVNAVLPRIGASLNPFAVAVVRQFEMMGIYTLNESAAISRARDKLRSLQILSMHKINMPLTSFAHQISDSEKLIKFVGGAPLIVKLLEGSQGKGVVLAETHKAAESVIDAFSIIDANFLVQEFIHDSDNTDIRCFVIGNRVEATMLRRAKEGDFRANLHRGGRGETVAITDAEHELAVTAANAIGLSVAGVDIIRSKNGPKLLEVNSSPGLEGIETISKINVAGKIIEYIEQNCSTISVKTKGFG